MDKEKEKVLYNNCEECNQIRNNCIPSQVPKVCPMCGYVYTEDDLENW